ncbi:uncharacterized protein B0P05DRAFT_543159 [Gilbertella persicaria]|uniref:uncharacterized protein n=1 Tax=Gilbertella persicaria TaxID=101096 RepID=UPI00221F58C9|nr:uncharacterized protein B0P05DRAFT_543159 [Gilbertella persicaria]KAI8078274.1 hypothetical protein B0P05DRAFT_543159 [Gilbertella persicaria]
MIILMKCIGKSTDERRCFLRPSHRDSKQYYKCFPCTAILKVLFVSDPLQLHSQHFTPYKNCRLG